MAGVTTAERGGERRQSDAGPPSRRPTRRRPAWLPRPRVLLAWTVLAALLGGFGTWALYGSDWLRIDRVSVNWTEGPRELTEEEILTAAAVPVGSPMASLDKGAVGARLLAELPRLDSVRVVRAWPDGVSLKVVERVAVLQEATADGFAEVDDDGVAFAENPAELDGVPLLELREPTAGNDASWRRFGEERLRAEAASVLAALPGEVRDDLRVVSVASFDAITLELSQDRTIHWGSAEDSDAKADALRTLFNAAGDARHFDVSAPSVPATSGG
ncbi:FtsQ-type POTRA domain-containing protein [Streptomyces sp. 3MP-14]|uniref:FtsQ-type POTRA domain-containing protein n=1 Tax=Streptomyces mimosae TaxID=2586635 RepID=A0A5N6AKM4_9ACTN|nr:MULTISPECIES: FtsQ-type POTRA domain-containing protein [Streptomyces]KAB8168672.1 FtsQ-type POTRA domain-containing protein [Streptomyces mimosae]KAB8178048.1 FtsQ-type POTRA domain-containing protein [Streptomyces sp. 3MP-14]